MCLVKQGAGIVPEVMIPSQTVDTPKGLAIAFETLAAKVR